MKMSKQLLVVLAAVAGVLSVQTTMSGAEKKEPVPAGGGDRLGALREGMQEMARELNLTEEQKEKLQSIVRERLGKLRDVRRDSNLIRPCSDFRN